MAYLWANEFRLVYRRPHMPRLLLREGLVELRTTDGFRLEAVSLVHETPGRRRHWILFFAPRSRG